MEEFPSDGIISGEVFVEVFWSEVVEVIAVFDVYWAEAVACGMTMGFAVDAVVFVRYVVF